MPGRRHSDRGLGEAIGNAIGEAVTSIEPLGGGTLSSSSRATLESGRQLFLKTGPSTGAAEFETEAASLRWLAEPGAIAIPEVVGVGTDPEPWLAMEWIEPGRLSGDGAERLGAGLARLHRAGAERHGAMPPGSPDATLRIGPVHLSLEDPPASWPKLYADRLILPTLRMAADRGAIDAGGTATVERLCARIEEVSGPEEPPSRLHGDLWSGNVHAGTDGRPWLIDPIAYGGHREIDLAMLDLFGSPGRHFLAAYDEEHSLPAGHRERTALWQLFPLLVHSALFGGSYGSRAASVAARYVL